MKTISLSQQGLTTEILTQINETLEEGGLVCIPSPSGYKLLADLQSPQAVVSMLQAKRRVKNAPALVFLPDESWVDKVADNVTVDARKLMGQFWPGPVTLLFKANDDLHPKVKKALTKAKGWLGVRVPEDDLTLAILKNFKRPVIVSSANLAKKAGANSVAQVKKNFGRTVDLLLEKGDIAPGSNSTLVDVSSGEVSVIRAGAVAEEEILSALAG